MKKHQIKLQCYVGERYIFGSIHERTDAGRRKVANAVNGVLKRDQMISEKSFLLSCQEVSAVNHATLARVLNSVFRKCEIDMLLLVTDPTPHKKEAQELSVSCPKLIHITCAVYALSSVCETIRVLDLHRDKLVDNVKKIFVKSPDGRELFKNKAPDTQFPSAPLIIRQRTWWDAIVHQAETTRSFVLRQINFKGTMVQYCKIWTKLNKLNSQEADVVENSCFSKNKGFKVISEISCAFEEEGVVDFEDLTDLSVTSCVTRTQDCYVVWNVRFSAYSSFRNNRQRVMTHNLKVTSFHCNSASRSVSNTQDFWCVYFPVITGNFPAFWSINFYIEHT